MTSQVSAEALFKQTFEAISNRDHPLALTTLDKLIQTNPDDIDALHSKAVLLISEEKYFKALEAIKLIEKAAPNLQSTPFLKAYCLLMVDRYAEAYMEVERSADTSFAVKHLKAQIAFKLEMFPTCFEIYCELLKLVPESHPDFHEVYANYLAAIGASLLSDGSRSYTPMDSTLSTHESLFNMACIAISKGDLDRAKQLLDDAAALCKRTLEGEMFSKDEIYQELVPIRLQQAYVKQLQGKVTESAQIYSEIIANKFHFKGSFTQVRVDDSSLITIATNNLLSTKGLEEEAFETLHTLKMRVSEDAKSSHRLFKMQKGILAWNEMALYLRLQQFPHSFSKAKKMERLQPTGYRKLHSAVVNFHLNRPKLAIAELEKQVEGNPGSVPLNLALAQLFLQLNRYDLALAQLEALYRSLSSSEAKVLPGLVGALVWLYDHTSQPQKSESLLEEAASVESEYRILYQGVLHRKRAFATLANHQPGEAAAQFQHLLSSDPGELESLRGLILALSLYDPALAEQYLEPYAKPTLDPAALEDDYLKSLKRFTSAAPAKKAKVKKCKRRNKPPKHFNPNSKPDPQRWLRMSNRTYFKSRPNKPVRANQGAVEVKEASPQPPQPSTKPKASKPKKKSSR